MTRFATSNNIKECKDLAASKIKKFKAWLGNQKQDDGEYFPIIFIIMLFYTEGSLGKSACKHVRFNINKDSCLLMLLFYAMIVVAILGA